MKSIYFIGIGGIGMSAIARYFHKEGYKVAGYDRTPSPLTESLEAEGIAVHYTDDVAQIGAEWLDKEQTVVIYTPAVPADHTELCHFRNEGFEVLKRSEILGVLTRDKIVSAIAGTHGKTTTTTLLAWITHCATGGGNAFLGGISKNFDSNLVMGGGKRMAVEADEYDRSFLRLRPNIAVITSTDADHLDIYGTHAEMKRAFGQFVERVKIGGVLIKKYGLDVQHTNRFITTYTYSLDNPAADFYAENVGTAGGGTYRFDLVCPDRTIYGLRLGVGGKVNVENAVAAVAALWAAGWYSEEGLRRGLESFSGVKRRFECYINTSAQVYIDDYAHHPQELRAAINSIRDMYPGRQITAIFQPHLYTRTRDFHAEFGRALSLADKVYLLPIYPAREEPLKGVTSELIERDITVPCKLLEKSELASELEHEMTDVVVTFGAGDIDRLCAEVAAALEIKASCGY